MKIRKAFKFRLNVAKDKQEKFFQFAGACRFVWNKAWHMNRYRLRHREPIMRYQELDFWSKRWKRSEEYGFLKECQSQLIQQKLKDLDRAFMDGFDKNQPGKRLPRKKKKGEQDSFRYPQGFKLQGNNIYLPKLGWYRFRQSQTIIGIPKNVTVSYVAGYWYVSIQTEYEIQSKPQHPSRRMVGVDMGVARFATLSTGHYFRTRSYFKTYEKRLKRAQRALSRKVKFSKNWKKQKHLVQKVHVKISNARHDYLHWCSNRLSKNHAIVVLEDLKIGNMSKSARGTQAAPGQNVKAKSGLNKSILDQGWGEFKRQLHYKLEWMGGELILVPPHHTSQTCPNESCRHVSPNNRKTQSKFVCVKCGFNAHADKVGAMNVLRAGHAQLACGDIGDIGPQAQESSREAA